MKNTLAYFVQQKKFKRSSIVLATRMLSRKLAELTNVRKLGKTFQRNIGLASNKSSTISTIT
jgi:hypothetical protein